MHYDVPSFGRSPWTPGFFSRAPWPGLISLIGAFLCTIGTVVVLVTSNGAETETWPKPDMWVQPSVVLSVLSAATNALLIMAFQEGVTISWWLKMLHGGSLNDCHRYWFYANSVWAAVTAGRHFNKVALACTMVALVVIDGPILQRASTVKTVYSNHPANFTLGLNQDLMQFTSGWYTTRAKSVDTISSNFTRTLSAYTNRDPITVRTDGCRGTCRGVVLGPGWDVNCTYTALPPPELKINDSQKKIQGGSISVEFGVPADPGLINLTTTFFPRGLEEDMTHAECLLHIGIVRHSIELDSEGAVSLRRQPVPPPANDTVRLDWPWYETGGMGRSSSKLGGIALAASTLFDSEIGLYHNAGQLEIKGEGAMAYQYRNSSEDVLGQTAMSWADPTGDVVAAIQELTFRSAVDHANANDTTELLPALDGMEALTTTVYEAHYRYLAGALALMVLAIVAMMPLFYGWWHLGRDVSLSPVEIAMAFRAPYTEGGDANANVDTLLKQIGKRRAQYGVVATSDFQESTRNLVAPGGGVSPMPSPGFAPPPGAALSPGLPRVSTTHESSGGILMEDYGAKSEGGGMYPRSPATPEARSPLAIADPSLLRRPTKHA